MPRRIQGGFKGAVGAHRVEKLYPRNKEQTAYFIWDQLGVSMGLSTCGSNPDTAVPTAAPTVVKVTSHRQLSYAYPHKEGVRLF